MVLMHSVLQEDHGGSSLRMVSGKSAYTIKADNIE